jgi:hypothetical protein
LPFGCDRVVDPAGQVPQTPVARLAIGRAFAECISGRVSACRRRAWNERDDVAAVAASSQCHEARVTADGAIAVFPPNRIASQWPRVRMRGARRRGDKVT